MPCGMGVRTRTAGTGTVGDRWETRVAVAVGLYILWQRTTDWRWAISGAPDKSRAAISSAAPRVAVSGAYGCSRGCLVFSIVASVALTILVNLLIRLF
jgi:hypothetical protein